MYSYKLNNSYTVYVNWYYINEARKASKKSSSRSVKSFNSSNNRIERSNTRKSVSPLPNGTRLSNRVYGEGVLASTDANGIMTVLFEDKSARFVYPDAVQQGFLYRVQ